VGRYSATEAGVALFSLGSMNEHLVYITCPVCNRKIDVPFSRTSGPVPFVHHKSNRPGCRLIVIPAERRAYQVSTNESLESALVRELKGAA